MGVKILQDIIVGFWRTLVPLANFTDETRTIEMYGENLYRTLKIIFLSFGVGAGISYAIPSLGYIPYLRAYVGVAHYSEPMFPSYFLMFLEQVPILSDWIIIEYILSAPNDVFFLLGSAGYLVLFLGFWNMVILFKHKHVYLANIDRPLPIGERILIALPHIGFIINMYVVWKFGPLWILSTA
ncbi:hypothetical protein ACKVMT_04285 [Halobacteriales archaeon Cl-PHB]